jgi:N-acetyl-gamma-glutamyl-phosphate reductase
MTIPVAATKSAAAKTPAVFIDGEAGATGVQIRERLAKTNAATVLGIDPARRKDPKARQALMAEADVVVLCLQDDAAKQAVALANELGPRGPRIIDASTAHRLHPEWVFGFPEMTRGQAEKVAVAVVSPIRAAIRPAASHSSDP